MTNGETVTAVILLAYFALKFKFPKLLSYSTLSPGIAHNCPWLHIGFRRKFMEIQTDLSVSLVAKVAVAMVNVKHMLAMVSQRSVALQSLIKQVKPGLFICTNIATIFSDSESSC